MKDELNLEVKSSEKVLFKGSVKAVSSINETGEFDILPFHANFFSIIKGKIVITDEGGQKKEILIKDQGILRSMENSVEIFLGI
ncbi:hypothetical protein B6D29_00675 [Microgenomates bacterium UTCPR1]|nr:MAG: hypothetical protein B6D29_00675 [Microgenomates bacterium UTCPR1]